MFKLFCSLLFFYCALAAPARAENTLLSNNGFVIAKAVKLGRKDVNQNTDWTNVNTGKNELIKNCNQNCENCDTSTGTCFSCKNGMFLNNNSSNNVCMSCPANATCNGVSLACKAGYYKNANSCSACPAGYYTSSGKCVPCPQGTFNPKPAQSNAVACIPCRPGILFIERSCQLFRLSGGNLFQRKRSLQLHTMPCQCHLRKWKLFM